jgi:3-oxoacyl-[acyl-carrier protein] reductase
MIEPEPEILDAHDPARAVVARYPELAGKVAVITGAAKGIGRGIATRLAAEGMFVVAADVDDEALSETAEALRSGGADVLAVSGDLSHSEAIDRLFQETVERFGRVDLLVNNAADLRRRRLLDEHTDVLDLQLATNVRSPYLCSQKAAAFMRDQGSGGSIVHISSVGALRAHHRGLPYDVTKGAINAMTLAMAVDLGEYGIRVNAIGPGVTFKQDAGQRDEAARRTTEERIPLRRSGTVEDIAAMVAFLASAESSYVTGQVIYVDGGITAQLSPPGPGALEKDGRQIQPGERNQTL